MPGIKSGDLGPKMGYFSKDNGWLSFDKVRVLKEMMLQRFMSIDEDGAVEMNGDPRILFGSMLRMRNILHYTTKYYLSAMLTIAIRYSVVRR